MLLKRGKTFRFSSFWEFQNRCLQGWCAHFPWIWWFEGIDLCNFLNRIQTGWAHLRGFFPLWKCKFLDWNPRLYNLFPWKDQRAICYRILMYQFSRKYIDYTVCWYIPVGCCRVFEIRHPMNPKNRDNKPQSLALDCEPILRRCEATTPICESVCLLKDVSRWCATRICLDSLGELVGVYLRFFSFKLVQ